VESLSRGLVSKIVESNVSLATEKQNGCRSEAVRVGCVATCAVVVDYVVPLALIEFDDAGRRDDRRKIGRWAAQILPHPGAWQESMAVRR